MCPGTTVSLTCSHDSTGDLTRWEIGAPIVCSGTATHTTNPSDALCGIFIINMVSAMNQPTRMSTLVLPVDLSLNGSVVTCYAGALTSNPQAGNLTIHVIGEILPYIACIFRGYKCSLFSLIKHVTRTFIPMNLTLHV